MTLTLSKEQVFAAIDRHLLRYLLVHHIVPITCIAALVYVLHQPHLPIFLIIASFLLVGQVQQGHLSIQMFLELHLVSEVVKTDLYLVFAGRCREVLVGFIVKYLLTKMAAFDYSYFRT
jgi:hypothetical protein